MPFDARGCWYRSPPLIVTCRECGVIDNVAEWVNLGELEREQLCPECLGWTKLARIASVPASVRAGGKHYLALPDGAETWGGHKALAYRVQWLDGRALKTTTLWCQGVIPPRFRRRLPDNAVVCES